MHRHLISGLALAVVIGALPTTALAQTTSNFGHVGFDLDLTDASSFSNSVAEMASDCDLIPLDDDDAVCMIEKDNGGQIWIGLREVEGQFTLITANPAFVGKSQFPVEVEGRVSDPDWEPYEYKLSVRFAQEGVPLLVEIADPREASRFAQLDEPQKLTLDLTAFTFEPEIYKDADAFTQAQRAAGEDVIYAPNFFIPSGLFGNEATAHAWFAGEVLEAELITTSDGSTHWLALVKVLGDGTVNVVFDDVVTKATPRPGNILTGEFWLSAQLPSVAP